MSEELQATLFRPGDLLLQRADATLVSALSRLDQARSRHVDVVGKGLQLHPFERTHREALIHRPWRDNPRSDATSYSQFVISEAYRIVIGRSKIDLAV